MNTITTVIFDMYETLAQNRQGHWLATFENIVQQQELATDPGFLRQVWLEKGRGHIGNAACFRARISSPILKAGYPVLPRPSRKWG